MYTVTDRFLQTIRQTGKRKTVVDLYLGGALVQSDVAVSDGNIRIDRGADHRRSGSLTIPNPDLVPAIKSDALSPYGTEVVIRHGVQYPDGSSELVPQGVFTLEQTRWDEATGAIPRIEFYDRSKALQRINLTKARDLSGQRVQQVITDTLLQGLSSVTFDITFDPALPNMKLPGGSLYDQNYWTTIEAMLEAMGAEGYFDNNGDFVVKPIPYIDRSEERRVGKECRL